jgi:hypothetical protein
LIKSGLQGKAADGRRKQVPRGNAHEFSYGDMLRDEAEVASAAEPMYVVESKTFMTEKELRSSRAKLEEAAKRRGKVIGVAKTRGGYDVTVERANPKYKGGRK